MVKVRVRALHTHKRRKHWCVLHGFNLPVIMILLGVSKRAVAEAMGGSFDRDIYTTKCPKSTSLISHRHLYLLILLRFLK
jgi:hypothetical protein